MAQIVTITNPLTGQPAQVDQLDHTAQQIDDGIGFESTDYPGCYYRTVDGVVEWLNPPMLLGVEYRTTERYLGKPVYKKLIEFPSLTGYDYVYVYSRYGYVFHAFGEVETQYDNPDIAGTKYWNTIFPESTAPTDDIAYIALTNNYSVQVGVVLPKGTNSAYYGKKARVQVWYYKPED